MIVNSVLFFALGSSSSIVDTVFINVHSGRNQGKYLIGSFLRSFYLISVCELISELISNYH